MEQSCKVWDPAMERRSCEGKILHGTKFWGERFNMEQRCEVWQYKWNEVVKQKIISGTKLQDPWPHMELRVVRWKILHRIKKKWKILNGTTLWGFTPNGEQSCEVWDPTWNKIVRFETLHGMKNLFDERSHVQRSCELWHCIWKKVVRCETLYGTKLWGLRPYVERGIYWMKDPMCNKAVRLSGLRLFMEKRCEVWGVRPCME